MIILGISLVFLSASLCCLNGNLKSDARSQLKPIYASGSSGLSIIDPKGEGSSRLRLFTPEGSSIEPNSLKGSFRLRPRYGGELRSADLISTSFPDLPEASIRMSR